MLGHANEVQGAATASLMVIHRPLPLPGHPQVHFPFAPDSGSSPVLAHMPLPSLHTLKCNNLMRRKRSPGCAAKGRGIGGEFTEMQLE